MAGVDRTFTKGANMARQQGRKSGIRIGEEHPRSKLSDCDIDTIHYLSAAGLSHRQIAEKFDDIPGGISKSTIRDILNGRIRGQGSGRIVR